MPRELGEDDPNVLGALRNVQARQLLDGHAVALLTEQGREVFGPVEVDDDLYVAGGLAQLLCATVQIADVGSNTANALPFELQDDSKDAVGAGVLRPHVDGHLDGVKLLVTIGSRQRRAGQQVGGAGCGTNGHRCPRCASQRSFVKLDRRLRRPEGKALQQDMAGNGYVPARRVEQQRLRVRMPAKVMPNISAVSRSCQLAPRHTSSPSGPPDYRSARAP